jgi:hypothetical protein
MVTDKCIGSLSLAERVNHSMLFHVVLESVGMPTASRRQAIVDGRLSAIEDALYTVTAEEG